MIRFIFKLLKGVFLKKYYFLMIILILSGCSTRFVDKYGKVYTRHGYENYNYVNKKYSSKDKLFIYKKYSKKYNLDHRLIRAICFTESSEKEFTLRINTGPQKGSYYFKNKYEVLNKINNNKKYSYDIGLCQINNWWGKRLSLEDKDILLLKNNIKLASKIMRDNLNVCNGDIKCSLSRYNTGLKKSKKGMLYAKKVLRNKKRF